ncbi:hypothetical protein AS594_35830 [Streptomyces agglomeratus]|uniref:Uncharacterized protein n=1 Tax=Streptomyces agglomeratus TaxID=285458 RepID=A0A1E5PHY8_9ACTN|nr:hypothetical protein [Streptomyces agglomeratus]OEJ28994.1 hypothetical protein AS594_35830 [Streptomyces agglomeratus]
MTPTAATAHPAVPVDGRQPRGIRDGGVLDRVELGGLLDAGASPVQDAEAAGQGWPAAFAAMRS